MTTTDNHDAEHFLRTLRMGGIEGSPLCDDDEPILDPIETESQHLRVRMRSLTVELERLRDRLQRLESARGERPVSLR